MDAGYPRVHVVSRGLEALEEAAAAVVAGRS